MSKKAMKKEIKKLNKRLSAAFTEIEALNGELDKRKAEGKKEFNDWMIDHQMTELISGLAHERIYAKDAVRELGSRMGSVDNFLNYMSKRVPKAKRVIDGVEDKMRNDPKRKALDYDLDIGESTKDVQ
jgi:chromosome segregation ATPase